MTLNVNIGCGRTPTEGWINLDNSPAIKLAMSPIRYRMLKGLGLLKPAHIENIEWNRANKIGYADASKRLPFQSDTVDCIYASHMLEHMSRANALKFLMEAYRVVKPGGVIRVAVPDLYGAVEEYFKHGDADKLMSDLFVEAPSTETLKEKIRLLWIGYRHHQWMYDGRSLKRLIEANGFRNVEVLKPGSTKISDPINLDLFERSDESVYVEGIK